MYNQGNLFLAYLDITTEETTNFSTETTDQGNIPASETNTIIAAALTSGALAMLLLIIVVVVIVIIFFKKSKSTILKANSKNFDVTPVPPVK